MRKAATIKAVYDPDLRQLLQGLGILDNIVAGEMRCAVCGCPVDLDNLGTIYPCGDDICVSCDRNGCVRTVTIGTVEH